MRWFYSKAIRSTTATTTATNVVVGPFIYNNNKYGIKDNLMYKSYRKTSWSTYSITSTVSPVSGHDIGTTYNRLIGVIDNRDLSSSWGNEYPNTTIYGKYRFSTNIAGKIISSFRIPVNFKITLNNGTEFNGDAIQSNIEDGIYEETACGLTFFDVVSNTYHRIGSTDKNVSSIALSDTYKYMEIDFGRSPQDIPEVIKTWIESNADAFYEYSYTVKNQSGTEELARIIEAPTMVKGNLTVIGNTKTLVLTGGNDENYTLTWDSVTPEGKQFTGLSFSPNSTIANIPIGIDTYFNLEGYVSLYESYGIYRPPVTTFDINLYQNSAEPNRVDKTNYLTAIDTLEGVLRNETSIIDMVITFESTNLPNFNYVYIPAFNRYYFVTDISSIKYRLWQINLTVDVLMTYKDGILSQSAFIERNEHSYNNDIIDNKRVVEQGQIIDEYNIQNDLFDSSGSFVLNAFGCKTYIEEEQNE